MYREMCNFPDKIVKKVGEILQTSIFLSYSLTCFRPYNIISCSNLGATDIISP